MRPEPKLNAAFARHIRRQYATNEYLAALGAAYEVQPTSILATVKGAYPSQVRVDLTDDELEEVEKLAADKGVTPAAFAEEALRAVLILQRKGA